MNKGIFKYIHLLELRSFYNVAKKIEKRYNEFVYKDKDIVD